MTKAYWYRLTLFIIIMNNLRPSPRARAANDTSRAQINNIPEKSRYCLIKKLFIKRLFKHELPPMMFNFILSIFCGFHAFYRFITFFPTVLSTWKLFNPLTAEWALRALIDFTLSNARRFYSSMGNPLDGKGLTNNWISAINQSTRLQTMCCFDTRLHLRKIPKKYLKQKCAPYKQDVSFCVVKT